jgi:hypothetical protein
MSAVHWLVVCWWLLLAVVGIPSLILPWRLRAADRKAAVLSYPSGNPTGHYPVRTVAAMLPRPIFHALALSWVLLFVAGVALVLMSQWTFPLLLNLHGRSSRARAAPACVPAARRCRGSARDRSGISCGASWAVCRVSPRRFAFRPQPSDRPLPGFIG